MYVFVYSVYCGSLEVGEEGQIVVHGPLSSSHRPHVRFHTPPTLHIKLSRARIVDFNDRGHTPRTQHAGDLIASTVVCLYRT